MANIFIQEKLQEDLLTYLILDHRMDHKSKPDWDKVVLAIDDAYYAPLRAEIFTKSSRLLRSNIARNYKKVGEQWIVKSLDCTNRTDRSNTRLEIIGAATQLDLSPVFW